MGITFLEDRLHPHLADAHRWIGHLRESTESVDLSQIVEVKAFDLHKLRGKSVILVGNRGFWLKNKLMFDSISSIN